MHQELADAGVQYMRHADAACALTRWQHLSAWSDGVAAMLNVWRYIQNRTPSFDAYLLEE